MAKYKIRNHHSYEDDGTTIKSTYQSIEDTELKLGIPTDENNTDYRNYLTCVSEGNTTDPAE